MRPSSLFLLPILLVSCQRPAATDPQPGPVSSETEVETVASERDGMVMRTYAIDPDRAREVRPVLMRLLAGAENQPDRGRVEELGGGRIVVVAPPAIQHGVQQMLDEIAQIPTADRTRSVDVSYWFVLAEPASEGNNATDFPVIGPALEEVAKHSGPVRFEVIERASLRSLLNERSDATGKHFAIEHSVSKVDQRYVADLRIHPTRLRFGGVQMGKLETRVVVEPGTLLMVGQSGYVLDTTQDAKKQDDDHRTLYSIVRIDSHDE